MAEQISTQHMASGSLQAHALHYELLRDYYSDARNETCRVYSALASIAQARDGLPQLEHELNRLSQQVEGTELGRVVDQVWIDTLSEITVAMNKILERRVQIQVATLALDNARKALLHTQKTIADWYTEGLPDVETA